MKIIYCALLFLISNNSSAQPTLEIADPSGTGGNYGSVSYLDVSNVGQKKVTNLSYQDVRGSAFWDEKWNAAIFIFGNNKPAKVTKARLNLYTNEVQFIALDGTELAFENTKVLKIVFFKGIDTNTVLAVFESLPDSLSPTKFSYYQVLNNGTYKLLELKKMLVKENEYNPTTGTNEFSFYSKMTYAIGNHDKVTTVKLSQSWILPAIHPNGNAYTWLSQNKNKLKSISEIISFLDYYNGMSK